MEAIEIINGFLENLKEKPQRRRASSEPTGIFRVKDKSVLEKLKDVYFNNSTMGLCTGFLNISPLFKHVRGNLDINLGYMNMGKTTWKMNLDMVQALKYGHKFAWFPPENMGAERFFDELICIYTGKQSSPRFESNRMTNAERLEAIEFINKHFFVVYPPDEDDKGFIIDSPHTIDKIEERFAWLIENEGVDGVRIDPFNQMDFDSFQRDDKLIGEFMKRAKRFAVNKNVYYSVSMHPKAVDPTQLVKDENSYTGDLKSPDDTRIAGGAMAGNKADQIAAYHRPCKKSDPKNTDVLFTCVKSKNHKMMGMDGSTDQLKYNRFTSRFEEYRSDARMYIDVIELEKSNMKNRLKGHQESIINHDGSTDNPQDIEF